MLMQTIIKIINAVRFFFGLWNRQYYDSKIILEQHGELRYLHIPANVQRGMGRCLLSFFYISIATISGMGLSSFYLHTQKLILENSHREIYMALQSAGVDPESPSGQYSKDEILEMAQAIRQRDMQIRQYVGDWTANLAAQNNSLKNVLNNSGLDAKVINIIQRNTALGGVNESLKVNPLISGDFAKETVANKELRDVLEALPSRMPLDNFSVTSGFGIRHHPILQKPSLHSGTDLISATNNDDIRAVKAGKVIVARYDNLLGNMVLIRHERGLETLYGHLEHIYVKPNEQVPANKIIGTVGNTGQSTGKHLHFEVLIGSYQVDPQKVIKTAQNVYKIQN